jgi:hypothetical protein
MRTKHMKIIAHRDRRIAHSDVAIVSAAESLDGISRADVQEALNDIVEILNRASLLAGKGQYLFDLSGRQIDHQVDLMCHLLISGNLEHAEQLAQNGRRGK